MAAGDPPFGPLAGRAAHAAVVEHALLADELEAQEQLDRIVR